MKFSKFTISHFGKLHDLTIPVNDGITIIEGDNESGKSTLHTFISSMLFGLERGRGRAARNDDYTKFTPWDGGTYGGSIEVEKDDATYLVTRNFSADSPSCTITNETEFRQVQASPQNLSKIFAGLTPTAYQNTISVSQLSASTGEELSSELRNHIVNLRTAGSFNLDVTGAVAKLKLKKKKVEADFSKPVAQEAEELRVRIDAMETDLERADIGPSVYELEAQKKAWESEIASLEDSSKKLSRTIDESDATLRAHHIFSAEEARGIESEVSETCDYVISYREKHRFNAKNFAKSFWTLLLIFSVLISAGAGFYAYLRLADGDDLLSLWPFGALCLGALILLAVSAVNLASVLKYRRRILDACDLYEEFIGASDGALSDKDIANLKAQPKKYLELLQAITDGKAEIARGLERTSELREKISVISTDLEGARETAWQCEQKEEALTALRLRLDMLSEQLKKNAEISSESKALELAINTIETISNDVFESFGHFLEETTSELFRSMTDGDYQGVSIDDSFEINLIQNEKRVPLSSVSTGTLDQIYLAVRLACIEFLWPDESMPLLLDDTFAMYDEKRLLATLSWLSENYSGQVIIFTCHKREGEILDALRVPYERHLLAR